MRAEKGGVFVRQGHTEAAVDLARAAKVYPAGAIAELINPDGTMTRYTQLYNFAEQHHLRIITIEEIRRKIYRIG